MMLTVANSNLALISSELVAWGGAQQRNQPYVDGALFSMTFLLACQGEGYATCPSNLAITHKTENAIRSVAQIPAGEHLIMMIAFGKPPRDQTLKAAASPRRPLVEILKIEQT
jgi:nitroreductase